MIRISATVNGVDEIKAKLAALEKAVDSVELLDEAEAIVLNRVRTRFLAEVDTEGHPWFPSIAGINRRFKGGTGTLFDTGTLFHSIQEFSRGPEFREIGTDVPYGPIYQLGLSGQVRREFLGVSEEDSLVVEKFILKRIEDALK